MKHLLENWRGYLQEEEYRQQILDYLEENNIVLTEEELAELMPAWMMKLGKGASLVGALSGAGQKADAGPGHRIGDFLQRGAEKIQQMKAPKEGLSEDGKSFTAKEEVFNDLQIAMDTAGSNARTGLVSQGDVTDVQANDISISYNQIGNFIYATATAN